MLIRKRKCANFKYMGLLLIYRKPDDEVLQLVRLGSHSELFGK